MEKRGLILVVGSAGSGKSTSIASMIDHRNELVTGHMLTFEDPIEFLFRNKKSIINQREIGSDAKTLYDAMRNAMRQAPDVLFIGEIRDREMMQAAVSYSMSGHLVVATMHGNQQRPCAQPRHQLLPARDPQGAVRGPGRVAQGDHLAAPGALEEGRPRADRGDPDERAATCAT